MDDGKLISITHTGSTLIKASKIDFKLLTHCAPSIKRNLVVIAKFYQDNLKGLAYS